MFRWSSEPVRERTPCFVPSLLCASLILSFLLIDSRSSSALRTGRGVHALAEFVKVTKITRTPIRSGIKQ